MAEQITCHRVRAAVGTVALLARSRGAELLVLDSRGHSGFAGALLGSVGQHCGQHVPCPVVIVRGESS
ncbi:universal stress protein [Kitasatospora sp. NPDC056531]|uniref:universal stress protein n=1 Tax=Kitasatospora sp. NPDC056531 TaxID=3345856 RepID=UPI0036CBC600